MVSQTNVEVTINGSGFIASKTKVWFWNNKEGVGTTVVTSSQVRSKVPYGATTGPISVTVNGGPPAYGDQEFTVIGPGPYITSFDPQVGSGGGEFYIYGVQFGNTANITAVKVNGTNVGYYYVLQDTQIYVTNRLDVTTGPITVCSPKGTNTTSSYFYVSPIVVNSFSPFKAAPETTVTITGRNFLGVTNVQFGGVNADFVASATQITAQVPTGAPSGPIRVKAPGATTYTTSNFCVVPTISGFYPGKGNVNTNVTITGANFNEGFLSVKFNGFAATCSGLQFGQLTAKVPAGATTGTISVTTSNGTATSSSLFFLPPSITSFTPTNSPPATLVKIQGQNFSQESGVTFNGVPAMEVNVTNSTTIGARVPLNVTTGPIGVTTPGGTATSAALFYAPPVVNGFSPTHGLPGNSVTIYGTNFLGATLVKLGSFIAATNSISNGQIVITVPTGAQTGPVTVIAPAGTNTSSSSFVLDYTSDLWVGASDAPDPVIAGATLSYILLVANNGPYSAANVQFTNLLPATVVLKSATTSKGTLSTNGNAITCSMGTVDVGAPVVVTLNVMPQAAGTITNIASVSSDYPDPVLGNNTTNLTTMVQLPRLTIDRQTNLVKVSWPAQLGWWLQTQTNSLPAGLSPYATNWHTVPSSSVTNQVFMPLVATNSVFYRLLAPW